MQTRYIRTSSDSSAQVYALKLCSGPINLAGKVRTWMAMRRTLSGRVAMQMCLFLCWE